MILSFEQIKEITSGAVQIERENDIIRFYRFTTEQAELYKNKNYDLYKKVPATAGVKMCFTTDGESLEIEYGASIASSRTFFSLDVCVNGEYIGSSDNFSNRALMQEYPKQQFSLGEFKKSFDLKQGAKEVSLYFPWSVVFYVKGIRLRGATYVKPVKRIKKLMAYGDSITQGYDALRPYKRYVARIADALNAEEINKAIGGEVFPPELADLKDDFIPDYISVAYGTNDWSKTRFDDFRYRAEKFFYNINKNYPTSKIFAISPIWRINYAAKKQGWDFYDVEKTLCGIAERYNNIEVINAFDFVPHEKVFFSDDDVLHPNDAGFERYAESLIKAIRRKISTI